MNFRWISRYWIALALLAPSLLHAQEPAGVRLQVTYQPDYQPGLVVLPFATAPGAAAAATEAQRIIRQDLDFSDRFQLREAPGARAGEPVNAAAWKERGADWVVDAEASLRPGGTVLRVKLYDAVYGQLKNQGEFAVPSRDDERFRMAVHAVSDEIVRWATGERGAAASRIAFVRQGRGAKEIYLVDSDGENLARVTRDNSIDLSPAWSPDGARIAYTSFREGTPALYERNLTTGRERVVSAREGINITPAYSPDGGTLAFAASAGGNTEVMTLSGGAVRQQTRGRRFDSLSPTWSPDGARMAFVSNRLGEPHIYLMRPGGEPRLLSEYAYGGRGYNTSPDWSPIGSLIAYQSRIDGVPQLMSVDADGGTRRLLTNRGSSEDPSWAPDGRHLVFSSPNRDGGGLFVLDTASGRVRPLLRGAGYGLPAWSPRVVRPQPTQ